MAKEEPMHYRTYCIQLRVRTACYKSDKDSDIKNGLLEALATIGKDIDYLVNDEEAVAEFVSGGNIQRIK